MTYVEDLNIEPLSPAEQRLATESFDLVMKFLAVNKLSEVDWYDVVIFGYLHAIKKWFQDESLMQNFSFRTVAWNEMKFAMKKERNCENLRIKTVGLSDLIPGQDGLTYMDMVSNMNLKYTYLYHRQKLKKDVIIHGDESEV